MALSKIAADLTAGVPWQTCAVCHHMESRGGEWADTLRRLLADKGVKFTVLAQALRDDPDEPTIGTDTLSRHARGLCAAGEVLR